MCLSVSVKICMRYMTPMTPDNASQETALVGNAKTSIFALPNETGSKLLIQTMVWQFKAQYTLLLESLAQKAFLFIHSFI